MALTQSARIPGPDPSWDEEVVPALRKRLENESRTLSRRLSGMSLIADSHYIQTFSSLANGPTHDAVLQYTRNLEDTRPRNLQASAMPSSSRAPQVNGLKNPVVRSRTLSQPLTNAPNANTRPSPSGEPNGSARPSDPRPTRIPKVSKATPPVLPTSPPTNHVNGFGQLYTMPSLSSLGGLSRQVSGILDEPPPFPTESVSSTARSKHNHSHQLDDVPRLSVDSDERPFEHWYRGEISRNGGVGELRVGRRQEMLKIANYGHTIAKRQIEASSRTTSMATTDDGRWRRKRAGSVGEIGRPERDSLYMDEEHMDHMGRVLDEDPPTDLDGEDESDAQSTSDHLASSTRQGFGLTSSHQIDDSSTASEPPLHSSQGSSSSTPTLTAGNSNPSTIRQNGPSRIPSPPRRSTEARATTPVQHAKRGASDPASSVKSTQSAPSTPRAQRQRPKEAPTPASAHRRAASPMSPVKKSKPTGAKDSRSKVKTKKETSAENKRRSVATYPLTNGEGDMAYAIPTWTQPKPREGNWDEVVLPVVARKKGLEDQYEQADGSPQPKRVVTTIEPAPGTFGFNHSKYRHTQDVEYNQNTDEFGRPAPFNDEEKQDEEQELQVTKPESQSISHDEVRLPVRTSPSPAPFAEYAPIRVPGRAHPPVATKPEHVQQEPPEEEEDKDGAGCCKCVIM
ncbi:hypothetical protein AX14_000715 [Amanita brunnescens Koide BX004]|nr:hypothetical protein AX14_000715 [Amanita brunnescens Koide BX004]